ncbi:MAG: hypothetical protein ACJ780_13980 [Solirubrobacteraceae bacterium]
MRATCVLTVASLTTSSVASHAVRRDGQPELPRPFAGGGAPLARHACAPDAIARWTPVPFELIDLDADRLVTGTRARVRGRLAGRSLEFDVEVLAADHNRLALVATGPISIDVEYRLRPAARGSNVSASVSVSGRGLIGRVIHRRQTRSSPPALSTSR